MSDEIGIKETQEVVTALLALGKEGVEHFSDGFQFSDVKIVVDLFKPMKAAFEGIENVDDELKDLSAEEIMQLGTQVYAGVKDIIAAVKAKKAE